MALHAHEEPVIRPILARLDALVDWERRDRTAGMRVTMAPMRDLLVRLGAPQRGRPLIHVAGTKGKGSTLAFCEAALEAQGLSTALFTSPHVESVCERLRVRTEPVAAGLFAAAFERTLDARAQAQRDGTPGGDSTWFDVVTAASAVAADASGVDVWLVEVGLGGRLDSTNALESHASGVVSIELEHMAVLGDTRPAIAAEKAGIARAGRTLVVGLEPDDPAAVRIAAIAADRGARVVHCPPRGDVDARNRRFAAHLLRELAQAVPTAATGVDWPRVQEAAARAAAALASGAVPTPRLPGRFERWRTRDGVEVLLDGAHVPESVELLLAQAAAHGLGGPFEVAFTCGRDKRVDLLLGALRGHAASLVCTELPAGRSPSAAELAQRAAGLGLLARAEPDPLAALAAVLAQARASGRAVLATGSLHLLGPLRRSLREAGAVPSPG